MEIAEVVDYAPHVEELKRLIRDVHEQANERNSKEAEEPSFFLMQYGAHNEVGRLVVFVA